LPVNPWVALSPTPAEPAPDPTPTLTDATFVIPLFSGGMASSLLEVGADRAAIGESRALQDQYPFQSMRSVRLVARIHSSTLPVGAFLAADYESPTTPGAWDTISATGGPTLAVDSASLDAIDANPDETAWVARSDWSTIRDEALADVRVRAAIGGGDGGSGELILLGLDLQVRAVTETGQPNQTSSPPADDPGSCDSPSTVDAFAYANVAALDAVWGED
jgi:hypothetical protein